MIIIPARLRSTRLHKKALADIGGIPMVVRTAQQVCDLDDVIVATDSSEIIDVLTQYDIKGVLTSENHESGTDRINEAATILGLTDDEVVINVQGDEPFIEPSVVRAVRDQVIASLSTENKTLMVSAYAPVDSVRAQDPNQVKVVLDKDGHALYFSRSMIPYPRDGEGTYFGHLGIYGFTRETLATFCKLPPAPIEQIERLEQLRALWNSYQIAMVEVTTTSTSIDTESDLERARKSLTH